MTLRKRLAAGFAAVFLALSSLAADAATITIVNLDGPGEGFNDTTPRSPEGGNAGTTLGQQRLNLFQAAANVWAAKLTSNVTIKVGANFDPLSPCTTSGGVLGSAGPTNVMKLTSPPAGYQANTWYSIAEAEAIQGANLNGTDNEIEAQFNSSVDLGCLGSGTRWWYGTTSGANVSGRINLFPVVLHELGHGLGFISLVCVQSGGCGTGTTQGSLLGGAQDIWNYHLQDGATGVFWKDMTNAQRANSIINDQHLVWNGANVTAAVPTYQPGRSGVDAATGQVKMYAPNPVEPGSSVSHFDTTASSPNLLMEPALQDEFSQTDMTIPLFQDIGWPMPGGGTTTPNQAPTIASPTTLNVTEDTASSLAGVVFADADAGTSSVTTTFAVSAGTLNATSQSGVTVGGTTASRMLSGSIAAINAYVAAGALTYTSALNAAGGTTLTVTINDNGNTGSGGAKTASNTVNLAIASVNDAPTLAAPASIVVNEASATALTGVSFADVDAGSASITATFAVGSGSLTTAALAGITLGGTATSRTVSGALSTVNAYVAAGNVKYTSLAGATTATLTVTVNDNGNTGSGGARSASAGVTLTIASVNDAPTLSAPASLTVAAPGATSLSGISIADADAGTGAMTLTLAVDSGALAATSANGVTASGSGTSTLVLTGTLANLNAFVATRVAFSTTSSSGATLTLSVNDNGNSGSGGAKTATRTMTLVANASILFSSGFE